MHCRWARGTQLGVDLRLRPRLDRAEIVGRLDTVQVMSFFPDRVAAMHSDLVRPTFTHPRQRETVTVVRDLLTELRACSSPGDYFQMQRQLFGDLLLTQGRINDLRRTIKRVSVGKPLDEVFAGEYARYVVDAHASAVLRQIAEHLRPLRSASVSSEQYSWLHLEELVVRRIEVQLRAVGDALAWRVLHFDRRYVHALSRNDRTGPMTSGRYRPPTAEEFVDLADGTTAPLPDTKAGLSWELGRATQLFQTKGTFALLNDLTNVIRIGDLTEIDGDRVFLHEVKAPNRRQDAEQVRRGQQAIAAINDGANLPGAAGTRLRDSTVVAQQHLVRLRQLVRKADGDGYSAATLEPGWVATVLSLGLPDDRRSRRFPGNERQEAAWQHAQQVAHRAAKISSSPIVHALSTDTAGRATEHAPWGIYPFDPDVCARLICDYILIECSVSLPAVAAAIRRQGAEVKELPVPQPLSTVDQAILLVAVPYGEQHPLIGDHLQMKGTQITARNLRQPLLETWTLDSWAAAIVELFHDPNFQPGESVIPILQHRPTSWL
jgi:hypothetical protein